MALTPAQKQKAYRDRQRANERAAEDCTYPYLRETFAEFLQHEANYSNVEICLGLAGIEAPLFVDDRGPDQFAFSECTAGVDNPFPGARGSIGRAEVIIDQLIDAANELAAVVNTYKTCEIDKRLAELQDPNVSDRSTAIEEAVTLNKMKDQLSKRVRRSFPQWKVTDA